VDLLEMLKLFLAILGGAGILALLCALLYVLVVAVGKLVAELAAWILKGLARREREPGSVLAERPSP